MHTAAHIDISLYRDGVGQLHYPQRYAIRSAFRRTLQFNTSYPWHISLLIIRGISRAWVLVMMKWEAFISAVCYGFVHMLCLIPASVSICRPCYSDLALFEDTGWKCQLAMHVSENH